MWALTRVLLWSDQLKTDVASIRTAIRAIGDPFVINGDASKPSGSRTFEVADAQFDYRQIGPDPAADADRSADDDGEDERTAGRHRTAVTEWLTSTGPITQTVEVMVLAYDHNPGVKYEYLMPTGGTNEHLPPTSDEYSYESDETSAETLSNSVLPAAVRSSAPTRTAVAVPAPTTTTTTTTSTTTTTTTPAPVQRRKRRFLWKIIEYGSCTKTCGGGFQVPVIQCVHESSLRVFKPRKCAHVARPAAIRCNAHACVGYWRLGEWSPQCGECSAGAPTKQQRDVKCVQELGTGMVIQIPAAACTEARPPAEQSCPPCRRVKPPRPAMVADQAAPMVVAPAAAVAGKPMHRRPRPLQHHRQNHQTTVAVEAKDRGVWLTSAWSDECARDCHATIEHRTIFCDRISLYAKRCELSLTPETSRQCPAKTAAVCAHGEWLVGGWTKCGGDCFNLTQSRQVVCVLAGRLADGAACRTDEKPLTQRACAAEEATYCQPQWHYSAWSEVSVC